MMAFGSSVCLVKRASVARGNSKRKDDLFLKAILPRRESIQRHEEVRKVPAVAQLALQIEQALQGYFLCQSVVKAKVVGANVDAAVGSQIVVGNLRNHRVRALGRKDIQERHITAIGYFPNLKCSQHGIPLRQTNPDVARGLEIESDRIRAAAGFEPGPVKAVSQTRDLKIPRRVNRAAGSRRGVARAGQRS